MPLAPEYKHRLMGEFFTLYSKVSVLPIAYSVSLVASAVYAAWRHLINGQRTSRIFDFIVSNCGSRKPPMDMDDKKANTAPKKNGYKKKFTGRGGYKNRGDRNADEECPFRTSGYCTTHKKKCERH